MDRETTQAHLVLDGSTARPARPNGAFAELSRWVCTAFLRFGGWKMRGDWPGLEKAVLLAAPHTSNWDGLNMLAAAGYYRIKLRWMGKKSLTQGPFGGLIKWLGCVPVDRGANKDMVKSMTEAFAAEARLILAISPEGTRTLTHEWKSGFYHIARSAGVPILLSVLDYGTRSISLAAVVTPSGDYEADLALIQSYYRDAVGKRPGQFAT